MKTSLADIQKLVALTAYLTQKVLLVAGSALFEGEAADGHAVRQKRSQIDRLAAELASQVASHAPASSAETSRAAVLGALGEGLRAISHDAEALVQAVSGGNRPGDDLLETLHALYEGSALLIAQAIGSLVAQPGLNAQDAQDAREAALNLRRNQERLADREKGVPTDDLDPAAPVSLPVRNISLHARRMAETARLHLTPGTSVSVSLTLLPEHFQN